MKTKHILIFEHDVLKYPPILSVINFLFSQNKEVILIGYSSSESFVDDFCKRGGIFYNIIENSVSDNLFTKTINYLQFKRRVHKIMAKYHVAESKVWLFGEPCIWLLHDLVLKFESNLYLFEIPSFKVSLRYKVLSPTLNYGKTLRGASKVVCCEYNRAHITRSFFRLKDLPIVIPNKPLIQDSTIIENISEELLTKLKGKKVILYQGIFNYPERRLDEFCQAMSYLSDDYVLCLMGSENKYKESLKVKFQSDKIIFMPYISAPHHLAITKLAHIGILVYNGQGGNIENTLNTLYCAPNKIFEYAKYGIPMISNDVPALNYIYDKYKCGISVKSFKKELIIKSIEQIEDQYGFYKDNTLKFFKNSNLKEQLIELL